MPTRLPEERAVLSSEQRHCLEGLDLPYSTKAAALPPQDIPYRLCASVFLAALIASEYKRSPQILSVLLLALVLAKMVMSWLYVPVWYHVVFKTLLIPMTMLGGKSQVRLKREILA